MSEDRKLRRVLSFIERAWQQELAGRPGHLNLALMAISGLILIVLLTTEGIEALMQLIRPSFSSHLPSFLLVFAIWLGGSLLCIALVGGLEALRAREPHVDE